MLEEISRKTKGMRGKGSVMMGRHLLSPKQPPLPASCVSLQRYFGKRLLKKLKVGLPYDLAVLLLGRYPKESKNTNAKRHMHPSVHSAIIHNSQSVEAASVSVHRWMDKEGVARAHSRILLSRREEWNCAACRSMDGFGVNDAKGRNMSTTWYQLYVESKTVRQTSKYDKKSRLRENKLVVTREERQFRGRRLRGKNY